MNDLYNRKLSVYDNVDLNESFEAAKSLINELNKDLSKIEEDVSLKQSIKDDRINNQKVTNLVKEIKNDEINGLNNEQNSELKNTEQLNGQNYKYTQEKSSTFILDNKEIKLNENSLNDQQSKNNNLKQQIKTTSSFKILKRKSSIPKIKHNDSKNKNNRNSVDNELNGKKIENQDKLGKKIEYNRSQSLINSKKNDKQNEIKNQDKLTPNKTSLIPRLSSPISSPLNSLTKSNKNEIFESEKLNKQNDKSIKLSNIPLNNLTTKTNLTSSNDENINLISSTTPNQKIKIYVPYAQINSQDSKANSKNNLILSSTNSINGSNGLNDNKDDLNKITINVNQKVNSNESNSISKQRKRIYLPIIDT